MAQKRCVPQFLTGLASKASLALRKRDKHLKLKTKSAKWVDLFSKLSFNVSCITRISIMNQGIKNKNASSAVNVISRLLVSKSVIPQSWKKATGLLRNNKQRRELERHVKKVRSEWS